MRGNLPNNFLGSFPVDARDVSLRLYRFHFSSIDNSLGGRSDGEQRGCNLVSKEKQENNHKQMSPEPDDGQLPDQSPGL